jgi:OOP family OmpA-OmpF porin
MLKELLYFFLCLLTIESYAQQRSFQYQIRYKKDKYEISESGRAILSDIMDSISGKSGYVIFINGHADSDGDSTYNQQLSLKRSLAIKDFFLKEGLDESAINVQALGETQPLVANSIPFGKAKNRRVEIFLLFKKEPEVIEINPANVQAATDCSGDTTVTLKEGYKLTMSKCDWVSNRECLRVERRLVYKIQIKENWLKKHIGFRNYKKVLKYEPRYEFNLVACNDSCFQSKLRIHIPHYNATGLKISEKYQQKRNDKNQSAPLAFSKTKVEDSAYYVADVYCPGILNCNTDNRCAHNVELFAKKDISILSYSYFVRGQSSYFDSLVRTKPANLKRLKENYRNAFFHELVIRYKNDTIMLKDIPIDVFAHGKRKLVTGINKYEKSYFLFIPYKKRHKCGHYKKYKIRAKDLENLMNFNLQDLEMES